MSAIKLIVGLANPGEQYKATRHNAGAWYLNALLQHYRQPLKFEGKFHGYTARIAVADHDVRLLIPNTFMNLSGTAVAAMASFYRLRADEILVAHDELDLPVGKSKFKHGGGHAGHNGLRDIIQKLGDTTFLRLRIGIGHPGERHKVVGYVLGKPSVAEQQCITAAIDAAVTCTQLWLTAGPVIATNRLHAFACSVARPA